MALLECQRCYQRVFIPVPEAETESLGEGFVISRHCENCRATTGWDYREEEPQARAAREASMGTTGARGENAAAPAAAHTGTSTAQSTTQPGDLRQKGRAPIRLAIKITRNKYGREVSDICETINVSRTGLYFTTQQGYDVGEDVRVILPYHPDSVAIPVSARVVRREDRAGTHRKGVAVHLAFSSAPPS